MKYIILLLFPLGMSVVDTLLVTPSLAHVVTYQSESDFQRAAPPLSIEGFDEFPPLTLFFSPQVVIDQVVYEVDGPCFAVGQPAPCWIVGIDFGGRVITAPNDFGAPFNEEITEHRISFGSDNAVHAFGFWFKSAVGFPPSHWEVILHEVDGSDTLVTLQFPPFTLVEPFYRGFVSEVGIRALTVRDFAGDTGAANWSYDNVSHSQILPLGDADGDGVPGEADLCPDSDLSATIIIDGCEAGGPNPLFSSGCTVADLIADCAEEASNHGAFVRCVTHLTTDLKRSGVLSKWQKGAIQRCAAQADIP